MRISVTDTTRCMIAHKRAASAFAIRNCPEFAYLFSDKAM